MWGDYIARITIASVVYARTGSALATAATFAVSMLPSCSAGASCPVCDRLPYRDLLVGSHLLRAAVAACSSSRTAHCRSRLLVALFALEFVGGPAVTAGQVLLTDIFPDRPLYARALAVNTLSSQVNQAIGLALGGSIVGLIGDAQALVFDLLTFGRGAAC